jgi:hypothetical protein
MTDQYAILIIYQRSYTNFIYVACPIDGFIAMPDGNINWLNEIPNASLKMYKMHLA